MAECECHLKGEREQGKEDSHANPKWSKSLIISHWSPAFYTSEFMLKLASRGSELISYL